jgi:hypothetical protein
MGVTPEFAKFQDLTPEYALTKLTIGCISYAHER